MQFIIDVQLWVYLYTDLGLSDEDWKYRKSQAIWSANSVSSNQTLWKPEARNHTVALPTLRQVRELFLKGFWTDLEINWKWDSGHQLTNSIGNSANVCSETSRNLTGSVTAAGVQAHSNPLQSFRGSQKSWRNAIITVSSQNYSRVDFSSENHPRKCLVCMCKCA